jgi:Thoeris protein ThsB, TIR-like domain
MRGEIRRADTFVLLIGNDTYRKDNYVKAEVEAAVEKGCRLIGVNLSGSRFVDGLSPWFFRNRGALYVPYSPHIVAEALKPWKRPPPESNMTLRRLALPRLRLHETRLHAWTDDRHVAQEHAV